MSPYHVPMEIFCMQEEHIGAVFCCTKQDNRFISHFWFEMCCSKTIPKGQQSEKKRREKLQVGRHKMLDIYSGINKAKELGWGEDTKPGMKAEKSWSRSNYS